MNKRKQRGKTFNDDFDDDDDEDEEDSEDEDDITPSQNDQSESVEETKTESGNARGSDSPIDVDQVSN